MIKYVLIRIILVLPTVLVISIIAFFLSRMVPGDQAEAMLHLQGMDFDSEMGQNDNYEKEYKKIYTRLHLDKPIFYLSVYPDYYPDDFGFADNHSFQEIAKTLLEEKHDGENVVSYINALQSVNKKWYGKKSTVKDVISVNQLTIDFNALMLSEKKTDIDKSFRNFQASIKDAEGQGIQIFDNELTDLDQAIKKLKKIGFHFPVLRWNGKNNQYHYWISDVLKGDFGVSMRDGEKIASKIWTPLKWTISLAFFNIILALIISIPLGIYTGVYVGSNTERVINIILYALYSIPVFWMATILIVFFTNEAYGKWTNIFPSVGMWSTGDSDGFWMDLIFSTKKLILPVICLTLPSLAYLVRIMRSSFLEEKAKIYTTTAAAKGLGRKDVILKHIVPNALIPMVTVIIAAIPGALAGTLVIEVIFNLPGMGRLMFDSIMGEDWNIVFAILLLVSVVTAVIYLFGDIVYSLLNPKIKFS